MKNEKISWSKVKEKYLEFHNMDSFTENMAIDIDFGYWLVNNIDLQTKEEKELPEDYSFETGV